MLIDAHSQFAVFENRANLTVELLFKDYVLYEIEHSARLSHLSSSLPIYISSSYIVCDKREILVKNQNMEKR